MRTDGERFLAGPTLGVYPKASPRLCFGPPRKTTRIVHPRSGASKCKAGQGSSHPRSGEGGVSNDRGAAAAVMEAPTGSHEEDAVREMVPTVGAAGPPETGAAGRADTASSVGGQGGAGTTGRKAITVLIVPAPWGATNKDLSSLSLGS